MVVPFKILEHSYGFDNGIQTDQETNSGIKIIYGDSRYVCEKKLEFVSGVSKLWLITIMFKYIRENIENAEEQAKQKLSLILDNMGYNLVTDIHNTNGIETRIYQWTNTQKSHCIQLIWDGKEDWFDLGEFQYTGDLNYLNATQILLVPIRREKLINRKSYISKKVDELIEAIKQNKV